MNILILPDVLNPIEVVGIVFKRRIEIIKLLLTIVINLLSKAIIEINLTGNKQRKHKLLKMQNYRI